jgi:hypothetical protein
MNISRLRLIGLGLVLSASLTFGQGCNRSSDEPDTDTGVKTEDVVKVDTRSDAALLGADLAVSSVDLAPIGGRKSGRFDFRLKGRVANRGTGIAKNIACSAAILPLESEREIETIERQLDLSFGELDPDDSREVEKRFELVADDDERNYNAQFAIECRAANESPDRMGNNRGVFESTVLYW